MIELTDEQKERIAKARKKYKELFKPQQEALRESTRITAEDLAITINAK